MLTLQDFARLDRAKITAVRPLSETLQTQLAESQLGQIAIGTRVLGQPATVGTVVIQAAKEEHRGFAALEAGLFITGGSTVIWSADKVQAIPVPDLALLLQQTPLMQITHQNAQSFAGELKAFANSTVGQYIVIGVSGGLVSMGIARYWWPSASNMRLMSAFIIGGLSTVLVIWLLVRYGVIVSKAPQQ